MSGKSVGDPTARKAAGGSYPQSHRAMLDAIGELAEQSADAVFPILCRNLRRLTGARLSVLSSFSPSTLLLRLESASADGIGDHDFSGQPPLVRQVSGKLVSELTGNRLSECRAHRRCPIHLFSECETLQRLMDGDGKCYLLSAVFGAELMAVGAIQMPYGMDGPSEDAVRSYMAFAAAVLRSEYACREAHECEARCRSMVCNTTDTVFVVVDGVVRDTNGQAARILGYSQDEIKGSPMDRFMDAGELTATLEDASAQETSGPHRLGTESALIHRDGRTLPVEVRVGLVPWDGGCASLILARDLGPEKDAEEKERALINDQVFISRAAVGLVELESEDEILRFIGQTTLEMFEKCVAVVNSFDETAGSFRLEAVLGDESLVSSILVHLGGDIVGMTTPITEEAGSGLRTGKLLEVPGGVFELAGGAIPREVCTELEKALQLERCYAIGFNWQGTLFGSMVLLTLSGAELRNPGLVEAFISQAAVALQRRQTENALRVSEENYRTLFNSKIDAVFAIDAETLRVVAGNETAARMFGFESVSEAIGIDPLDLVHPDDRERAARIIIQDAFQQDLREINEFHTIALDGREMWVSAVGAVTEYQGRVVDLVSLRDITGQKKAEEEKRQMEQQLHLSSRLAAVGELAAGVAHELNNPLTSVLMFSELVKDRPNLEGSIRKDIEVIHEQAQRASRITQNLLSFARRHKPEKGLISINEVVEKSIELHAYRMRVNNVEVATELDPELPLTMADFFQMQQVLVNMITNAEQVMTEAHGRGSLDIKTSASGGQIVVDITDDGPGISEENTRRIFDPFFTTKAVGKGTGLGLSICFGIVQEHGGCIHVRSRPGEGTTFRIGLPIVDHCAPEPEDENGAAEGIAE